MAIGESMRKGCDGMRHGFLAGLVITLLVAARLHAADAPARPAHTMLWVVHGSNNTVYLQGSLHLLKADDYPLDPRLEQAFTNSRVLVTELDLGVAHDPAEQRAMAARGTLPNGQTLREVLPPALYRDMEQRLTGLGVPSGLFDTHKPWLVAMSMTILKLRTLGFSPDYGLDVHFDRLAREQGKPVRALETVASQIDLFDGLAPSNQEALLSYTIRELDLMDPEAEALARAWRTGDESLLQSLLLEGFDACPGLEKRLLWDRNEDWVHQIEHDLSESDTIMVVVGAAHLVGPRGIVALLRQNGHLVEHR